MFNLIPKILLAIGVSVVRPGLYDTGGAIVKLTSEAFYVDIFFNGDIAVFHAN